MTNLLVLPAIVASDSDPVAVYNQLDRGSDRGSGYWQSNTILRHNDLIFLTWQSYDPNSANSPYSVWVGTFQYGTNIWLSRVMLLVPNNYAMDNHGAASIIADKTGFIHLLYGPHNGTMLEAVSMQPWDASAFHPPTPVTTSPWDLTTYSSIARDTAGTFHLLYRGQNNSQEWRLIYQRGTTNSTTGATTWGTPQLLASTADPANTGTFIGYSLYDGTIAVSDRFGVHSIHVAFQLYYDPVGAAHAWGYLRSDDGGNTWKDSLGAAVTLPIDAGVANATHLVQSSASINVRVCNIAISPHGNPWISVISIGATPAANDTKLWHLAGGVWTTISLSPYVAGYGSNWRISGATIAFDSQGVLYVASERMDSNDTTPDSWWGSNTKEVVLLMSSVLGATFQLYPVSAVDQSRAHWLANIERPTTPAPISVCSLLYTDGAADANKAGRAADIVYVPLYKY